MNPQAFYIHGSVEAELAFLDRCEYLPIYRQAAKDWYLNRRVWRPVSEDNYDYTLNAVPPIAVRRGFIAGEPHCHTREDKPVYHCFRYFNGVPHMLLATVEEHFHGTFPIHNPTTDPSHAQNQSHP